MFMMQLLQQPDYYRNADLCAGCSRCERPGSGEFVQYYIINKHEDHPGKFIEALAKEFAGIKVIDPRRETD